MRKAICVVAHNHYTVTAPHIHHAAIRADKIRAFRIAALTDAFYARYHTVRD